MLEVREESENVKKTLITIANPHIGIYREIGQLVLASIEKTRTHTHTHTQTLLKYIYRFSFEFMKYRLGLWYGKYAS